MPVIIVESTSAEAYGRGCRTHLSLLSLNADIFPAVFVYYSLNRLFFNFYIFLFSSPRSSFSTWLCFVFIPFLTNISLIPQTQGSLFAVHVSCQMCVRQRSLIPTTQCSLFAVHVSDQMDVHQIFAYPDNPRFAVRCPRFISDARSSKFRLSRNPRFAVRRPRFISDVCSSMFRLSRRPGFVVRRQGFIAVVCFSKFRLSRRPKVRCLL